MYRNNRYDHRYDSEYQAGGFDGNGWDGYSPRAQRYHGVRNQGSRNGYGWPPKKKSGCKVSVGKEGKYKGFQFVTGWNKSKQRGFIKAFVYPYHGTTETKGKANGNVHQTLMVKIEFANGNQPLNIPCIRNLTTGKVTFDAFGTTMVMNPKAPNGGYFGTAIPRKR